MTIHPSGVECSTASQGGRVLIWSAAEGQVSWVIEVGSGWVENSVGKLVTACICRGRGPEGTLPGVLKSQVQPVTTLAFAPGAIRLASGGRDGAVVVWSLQRNGRGGPIGAEDLGPQRPDYTGCLMGRAAAAAGVVGGTCLSTYAPNTRRSVGPLQVTHKGYSDESSWNQNRYRSIGLVTAPSDIADTTGKTIASLLEESGLREFAWKDLTTAKRRFAAKKIIQCIVGIARPGNLRVDVLVWDTYDTRHRIRGRDDTANLARMYYHLLSQVMSVRWCRDARWLQYVDGRADIDWTELQDCLTGKTRKEREAPQQSAFSVTTGQRRSLEVVQGSSFEDVLIQAADLFAGMAAFSWNEALRHREWLIDQSSQLRLIPQCSDVTVSNSASEKHKVLKAFAALRPNYVVFRSDCEEGLITYGPQNPINFWKYTPQGEYDKAPVRYGQ